MPIIKNCVNKEEWDSFFLGFPHTPFHQLWEWGMLEESRGECVWRLYEEKNGKIYKAVQVIVHNIKFGLSYAWAPRAMFFDDDFKNAVAEFICSKHKLIFCEFEYGVENVPQEQGFVRDLSSSWHKSPKLARLPLETLIIDVSKEEKLLLGQLKPKWRYNIGLAKRKGIEIKFNNSPEEKDIYKFYNLLIETSKRDGFAPVSYLHVQKLFKEFGSATSGIKIFLVQAFLNKKIIAANMLVGAGDTLTYLHGAMDYDARNTMAPHLMQWESIMFAKNNGYKYYDFWGLATGGDSKKVSAWEGITRFKIGFGGRVVKYLEPEIKEYKKAFAKFYFLLRK